MSPQGDVGAVVCPRTALRAQRGATPPDNDRTDFTFQRDVSKEHQTALLGWTSWFFPRWWGIVGCMWSAEALLPVAGAACILRHALKLPAGLKPPAGFEPAGG